MNMMPRSGPGRGAIRPGCRVRVEPFDLAPIHRREPLRLPDLGSSGICAGILVWRGPSARLAGNWDGPPDCAPRSHLGCAVFPDDVRHVPTVIATTPGPPRRREKLPRVTESALQVLACRKAAHRHITARSRPWTPAVTRALTCKDIGNRGTAMVPEDHGSHASGGLFPGRPAAGVAARRETLRISATSGCRVD